MKLWLGYLLVGSSLVILILTYLPVIKQESEFQIRRLDSPPSTEVVKPVSPNFGIMIPKLAINSAVIKDVDPFDPAIYQSALSLGVAHAKGSSVPGEKGNVFIFAHSSVNFVEALKYNSIFYLLPKLYDGDEITLYFQYKPYKYLVTEKLVVEPDRIDYLTGLNSNDLILMTCYPPGTNLKRFIILATPLKEE